MSNTAPAAAPRASHPQDGLPWWKFPLVWMVLSGPALVVVAGIATAIIAHSNPDPVIAPDYLDGNAQGEAGRAPKLAPAVTGRNHAATPAEDHPAGK